MVDLGSEGKKQFGLFFNRLVVPGKTELKKFTVRKKDFR